MREPSDFSSFHPAGDGRDELARSGLMDRRTMLTRALAVGAAVAGAPVLLSACTHASAAAPAGTASSAGPGVPDAQVPLFTWRRSLPIDSMSPGIGVIGGTELRALATMDGSLYAGNSYWRDSRQTDPGLPGAQVLVLDAPGRALEGRHRVQRAHNVGQASRRTPLSGNRRSLPGPVRFRLSRSAARHSAFGAAGQCLGSPGQPDGVR